MPKKLERLIHKDAVRSRPAKHSHAETRHSYFASFAWKSSCLTAAVDAEEDEQQRNRRPIRPLGRYVKDQPSVASRGDKR
jgi:hypothetical protein